MNNVNVFVSGEFIDMVPPGAVHDLAAHKTVEHVLQAAFETISWQLLAEEIKRNKNILWIANSINHLKTKKNILKKTIKFPYLIIMFFFKLKHYKSNKG